MVLNEKSRDLGEAGKRLMFGWARHSRDIAIVGMGGVVVAVLLNVTATAVSRRMRPTPSLGHLQVGDQLRIADVRFSSQTLVIFTSPACSICRVSEAFHRELIREAEKRSLPVLVVLPAHQESESYVQSLQCDKKLVRRAGFEGVGIRGTPTMAWVDGQGVVTSLWVGVNRKMSSKNLLEQVFERRLQSSILRIRDKDLAQLQLRQPESRILDVRDRVEYKSRIHMPGTINIPLGELQARSQYELISGSFVIVDCGSLPGVVCQTAINTLDRRGFKQLAALNCSLRRFGGDQNRTSSPDGSQ